MSLVGYRRNHVEAQKPGEVVHLVEKTTVDVVLSTTGRSTQAALVGYPRNRAIAAGSCG